MGVSYLLPFLVLLLERSSPTFETDFQWIWTVEKHWHLLPFKNQCNPEKSTVYHLPITKNSAILHRFYCDDFAAYR